MKKTIILIMLAVMTAAGVPLFGQAGGSGIYSPQVQERERRLWQGLSQEQLLAISQQAAVLESMPDPGADPLTAVEGILAASGVKGLAGGDAAFAVLVLSGRHLDEDLGVMNNAIGALSESRQALQAALAKMRGALGAGKERQEGLEGDKGARGVSAGPAGAAPQAGLGSGMPDLGAVMGLQTLQTSHFRFDYWRIAALAPLVQDGLSREQQLAEAGRLQAKLAWLDGLLAGMNARLAAVMQRRQALVLALDGMALRSRNPQLRE